MNQKLFPYLLFIIALVVFGVKRDGEVLSGDEPFTVYFSQWNVKDFVPLLFKYNNIPPTFEWILHWWMKWFGNDTASMRLLPALFTALSAPAIYLIAKKNKGEWAGILAAFLFILSPFQMEWAHLLRSYSMMIFGASWSMYFFISFLENKKNNALIGWILFSTIATAGHYLSWFVVFCQLLGFIGIVNHHARQEWKKILAAFTTLLVINIPFLYFLIKRFLETASEGTYVQPPDGFSVFFRELFRLVGCLKIFPQNWQFLNSFRVGIPFVALVILILIKWMQSNKASFQIKLIGMWLIIPFVLMFFASYKIPMFIDRYLSFISPAIPILLATLIISLPKRLPLLIGSIVVLFYSLNFQFTAERYSHPDKVMAAFKELKTDQNVAIWSPGYTDLIFAFHYSPELFSNAITHKADTLGSKVVHEEGYTIHKEGIRRALQRDRIYIANDTNLLNLDIKQQNEIIFVDAYSEYIYPDNGLMAALKAEFGEPVQSATFDYNVTVSLFQRKE